MDSGKLDVEFCKEVYVTLARHESSFKRVNATLQAVLTKLQILRTPSSTPACGTPSCTPSLATDLVEEEEKEILELVYDEYPEEDEDSISLQMKDGFSSDTDAVYMGPLKVDEDEEVDRSGSQKTKATYEVKKSITNALEGPDNAEYCGSPRWRNTSSLDNIKLKNVRKEQRMKLGDKPVNYHGKRSFWSIHGNQETVVAAPPALNLAMRFHGRVSFFLLVYRKLPLRSDKKTGYEYSDTWHISGIIAMDSAFWGVILHSRNVGLTKKLDLSSILKYLQIFVSSSVHAVLVVLYLSSYRGYPYNLDFDYGALFQLQHFPINNWGNPVIESNIGVHSRQFEFGVLDWFARLWGLEKKEYWGYVTNCGTEGNLHGILVEKEVFPDGIMYASPKSLKAARINRKECEKSDSICYGEIDCDDLKAKLLCHKFLIYCDWALFSFMMPLVKRAPKAYSKKPISNVSVSGHKFVRYPMPCGVQVTILEYINTFFRNVEYLASRGVTILGIKSSHTLIFLWCTLNRKRYRRFKKEVQKCLHNTHYFEDRLMDAEIGTLLNKLSSTMEFERPHNEEYVRKWQMESMQVMGDEICYNAKDYLTIHKLMATCANLHRTAYTHTKLKNYSKANQRMPMIFVKLYTYQTCRALAYILGCVGVCDGDIMPQDLLVTPPAHHVDEPKISCNCSRGYHAPELNFGATEYTTVNYMWTVGCILAELPLGQHLFPRESGVDQPVEIIKGTYRAFIRITTCLGLIGALIIGIPVKEIVGWWGICFWVSTILAATFTLAMAFCAENPHWLYKQEITIEVEAESEELLGRSEAKFFIAELSNTERGDETDNVKLSELLHGCGFKVVFIGSNLFALQQLIGINAVFYFSSTVFKSVESHRTL